MILKEPTRLNKADVTLPVYTGWDVGEAVTWALCFNRLRLSVFNSLKKKSEKLHSFLNFLKLNLWGDID